MDFTKDIYINKDKIREDEDFVILYKGFLFSNNLTNDVYVSYGYGDTWKNKDEKKMKPSTFGYLATIDVGSGDNLQFVFRDNQGNWDNNNSQNYILPIEESQEVLSFKTIADTSKEVSFETAEQTEPSTIENNNEEIFEPAVVNSNSFDLYKTVDLENLNKQAIPNDTIITQISLDHKTENVVSESIIKSEVPETKAVSFEELTGASVNDAVNTVEENAVSAGSVRVNSIVSDIPDIVDNIDEKSLTVKKESTLEKTISLFESIVKNVKVAFSKLVKLVKTSLNLNEEDE
jgi:hypothetical protein